MDGRPNLDDRTTLIESVLKTHTQQTPILFVGQGGMGCTRLGLDYMDALFHQKYIARIVTVRLHALSIWSDVIYALGTSLKVLLTGDTATVSFNIRTGPSLGILLDNADLRPDLTEQLLATFPEAHWVLTGQHFNPPNQVKVPPAHLDEIKEAYPAEFVTLPELGPFTLEDVLSWGREKEPLLLATAIHGEREPPFPQAFLSALVQNASSRTLSAVAAACMARESIRRFQSGDALDSLSPFLHPLELPDPIVGLLHFIRGHVLLALGNQQSAEASYDSGYELTCTKPAWRQPLSAQVARQWVNRSDVTRAKHWLRRIDECHSESLRLSAALAAQRGEWVGAEALLDAAVVHSKGTNRSLAFDSDIGLQRASLDLGRGALHDAESRLSTLLEMTNIPVATQAAAHFRRAEIQLKRGQPEAGPSCQRARTLYQKCGSIQGIVATFRLEGDVHACMGQHYDAVTSWHAAAKLCARNTSTLALAPILKRILALESEGVDGPHIQEQQSHLDLLGALINK